MGITAWALREAHTVDDEEMRVQLRDGYGRGLKRRGPDTYVSDTEQYKYGSGRAADLVFRI